MRPGPPDGLREADGAVSSPRVDGVFNQRRGGLEERHEEVVEHLLEALEQPGLLVQRIQTRHLAATEGAVAAARLTVEEVVGLGVGVMATAAVASGPAGGSGQGRHLDEPPVVGRVELVVDDPRGEVVPLAVVPAVDRDAELGVLVLGLLEVVEELARDLGEVSPRQLVPGG